MANIATVSGNLLSSSSVDLTGNTIAATASFAVSSSWAPTPAPTFPFTGSAQITGSLGVTGSFRATGNSTSGNNFILPYVAGSITSNALTWNDTVGIYLNNSFFFLGDSFNSGICLNNTNNITNPVFFAKLNQSTYVKNSNDASSYTLKLVNDFNDSTNTFGGILFQVGTGGSTTLRGKGGLVYALDSSGWNRGDFYFLQNTSANTDTASLSNAVVAIKNNGSLVIGSTSSTNSSIFEIVSTTKGFLSPRMTAAQRTAISAPAQGLQVYDTGSATEGIWYYNSGSIKNWTRVLNDSGSQNINGGLVLTGSVSVGSTSTNNLAQFYGVEPNINVIAIGGTNSAALFLSPSAGYNGGIHNRTGGGLEFYTGVTPSVAMTINASGNTIANGSVTANTGFTGSLFGTASQATALQNTGSAGFVSNMGDTYTGTAKITDIVTLNQTEYNAIGSPSTNTLYIIL